MEDVEVIHAWSTPRSLSTSLMYSFAQRDDMEIVDEPFYANFLIVTGVERPYRDELLSRTEPDVNKLVKEVIFGPGKKKYRYCKQIAYECPHGILSELLKKGKHFILIRNPINILSSFHKVSPASFLELGYPGLLAIYTELSELVAAPPVINAEDLQNDPEAVLRGLCDDLGIPFQASMLGWEAGSKEYDGVWAPWWYKGVHKSTCFMKPRKYPPVSVFDWVLRGGAVVLEGLCAYNGKVFKLDEHIDRILYSAKALPVNQVLGEEAIKDAIFKTLISNGMLKSSCIKLALICCKKVTFGKCASHDDLYNCTLIVAVERKEPIYDKSAGMKLTTRAAMPNNSPNLDSDTGEARDSIIMDKDGVSSKINATNIFMVKKGEVFATNIAKSRLPSITYITVVEIINKEKLTLHEQAITLSEFHTADEVWATGTMGEITPVVMMNGCVIGNGEVGPVTKRVIDAYKDLIEESGVAIPVNHDA
ncbi:D-alanine aminotransferase [Rhynchospora pubera]|uniref:D-alanine aminotransferase n=1 Tax=Rhynchospora pubera TaxID=906938 RepID=A0AAV8CLG6_9POAL|nr:D-alanine aminotransferase [Rhynchospora pubera]